MTVTAPPRPPRPNDPVTHGEFDALVEALIEEARQRGQRRRRRNAAVVTLVALAGVALFALLGGGAQSQTGSPALSARSSLPAAATSKIAFIREPPHAGYAGVLWVMNPDGSGQRRLAPAFRGTSWSPDGQKLAFESIVVLPDRLTSEIYIMNVDGSGQRELVADDVRTSSPAWSPDGRRIAFLSRGIRVVNADGTGLRRLTRNVWGDLAWSPDGRRIAFVSRHDGNLEIDVMNADGSGQRRLTHNTVRDENPVWSPDGRQIAFVSKYQVWLMNSDGSGLHRLTLNGGRNFAPAWSPDGQRIVFERRLGHERYRAETYQVYVIDADGSEARMLAHDGAQPAWSPDGQKIAFSGKTRFDDPQSGSDIYVVNADGSGKRKLTHGPRRENSPVWSPALR